MKNLALILVAILFPSLGYAAGHGGAVLPVTPPPILDTVGCAASTDAAYGTVKLTSAYAGYAGQMRVYHSGVYAYQNIGFVGNVIDAASADTFAATADAGTPPEIRFYDQCGNSNDTTFSGTAGIKGALWSTYPLANTSLRTAAFDLLYDSSLYSSYQALVLPTALTMNMDSFSTVFIGRRGSSYQNRMTTYWEFLNTAPWTARWYDYDSDGGPNILEKNGTKLNYPGLETTPGVYQTITTSSTSTILANEVGASLSKVAQSATSNNGGTLGYNTASGNTLENGGQDIVAQMFFNRTLSKTEQAAITNYGYSLTGNPTTIPNCIVVIGDSLSAGQSAIDNQNWINQAIHGVATPITKPSRLYNFATNGKTAATMLANIATYEGACSNAGVTNKLAIIMAGSNDISINNTSPSTLSGIVFNICTDMHNSGFKTVIMTIPNNNVSNNSSIAPYNAIIEANYAANHCDGLADVWSSPNIGAGSNTANLTYFNADQEHLTAAGYAIAGQLAATAINSIY